MKKIMFFFWLPVILAVLIVIGIESKNRFENKREELELRRQAEYSSYRVGMERINIDRLKLGEYPSEILSFERWLENKEYK